MELIKEIEKLDKLSLEEARELYLEYLNTKDDKLRTRVIEGTLYLVIDTLERNDILKLFSNSYSSEDILNSSIEVWIRNIDKGILLRDTRLHIDSLLYDELNSILVPVEEQIAVIAPRNKDALALNLYRFVEVKQKMDITYEEFIKIFGYRASFHTAVTYRVFSNICDMLEDREITISKRKLRFLIDIIFQNGLESIFENIRTIDEAYTIENTMINDITYKGVVQSILKSNALTDTQREVLIKVFGLDGKGDRTLEEIGEELSCNRQNVRNVESHALKSIRKVRKDILRSVDLEG